jgi:chromosome segregation ATPase
MREGLRMANAGNPESNVGQEQQLGESVGEATSDLFDLLSGDWKKILDKELDFLDRNRSSEFNLLKKEITDQTKYLGQWQPSPTKDDLEKNYSQSDINRAEKQLREQQEKWEEEKASLNKRLKEVTDKVSEQEKEIKAKEKELQSLLDDLKALPGLQEAVQKEVKQLSDKLEKAKGTKQEALIRPELEAAEEKLARLRDPVHAKNLDDAIREALDAWQGARDSLKGWMVTGINGGRSQEDLEIDIKVIDKTIEYLEQHWNALVQALLGPPPSQSAAQG